MGRTLFWPCPRRSDGTAEDANPEGPKYSGTAGSQAKESLIHGTNEVVSTASSAQDGAREPQWPIDPASFLRHMARTAAIDLLIPDEPPTACPEGG